MSDLDLDEIPQLQLNNFPEGVYEVQYLSKPELDAFLDGLNYVGDIDVEHSSSFFRKDRWVVRVKIGE